MNQHWPWQRICTYQARNICHKYTGVGKFSRKVLTCSKGLREAIGKDSLAPAWLAIGPWLRSYIEILHRRGRHGGQCAVYGLSLTGTWGDMATLIRRRAGGGGSLQGLGSHLGLWGEGGKCVRGRRPPRVMMDASLATVLTNVRSDFTLILVYERVMGKCVMSLEWLLSLLPLSIKFWLISKNSLNEGLHKSKFNIIK